MSDIDPIGYYLGTTDTKNSEKLLIATKTRNLKIRVKRHISACQNIAQNTNAGSAKPLFPGSSPGVASKNKHRKPPENREIRGLFILPVNNKFTLYFDEILDKYHLSLYNRWYKTFYKYVKNGGEKTKWKA